MPSSFRFAPTRIVTDKKHSLFYHVTDLPCGERTTGHWDLRETIESYLGNYDFSGKTALDVGTASGYLTFEMEKRGATVVSIDQGDPSTSEFVPFVNDPRSRVDVIAGQVSGLEALKNSYWYIHRALGSKARAYYGNVYELPDELGTFDVVMIGMMLPHLRDPLGALEVIARRSTDAVIITQQALSEDRPVMQLMAHPDTQDIEMMRVAWWLMSDGLMVNFMRIMGFKLAHIHRANYLCTAYIPAREEECTTYVFRRR